MEKVSNLISKKVISIEEGKLVGYVLNVFFDNDVKKYLGVVVVDDESENTFLLNKEDIICSGQDCIMIENSFKLQYEITLQLNNPIGKCVYDMNGQNLGFVKDVEINGSVVKKIITDRCEFLQKFIYCAGDDFIILGNCKNKRKKINKKITEKLQLPLSQIMTKKEEEKNNIKNNEKIEQKNPIRLYVGENKLIGKRVKNNIFGLNNELIIKENQINYKED